MSSQPVFTAAETIRLRDFFADAGKDIFIPQQPDLFEPDAWARAFAQGLRRLSAQGTNFGASPVLEVGVGTGINMAGLLTARVPAEYMGVDYMPAAVLASGNLAKCHSWPVTLQVSDLLSDVSDQHLSPIRHIIACIPQVPLKDVDLRMADNAAHFYPPTGSRWDPVGLGLNNRLLAQASARAPQAAITLNLAGRPGIDNICAMFRQHGYAPEVLYSTMVRQHAGTSLASLAEAEGNSDQKFEFFIDEQGEQPIGAVVAEDRRLTGQSLYHKMYVMTAPALRPEQ